MRRSKAYFVFHIVRGAKGIQKLKISCNDQKSLTEIFHAFNFLNYVIRNFKVSHQIASKAKERIRLVCSTYRDDSNKSVYDDELFIRVLTFNKRIEAD